MSAFERLLRLVEEQPLSRSLPVVLRVVTAIEDKEVASWIRLELMGYLSDNPAMKDDIVVPEYRSVPGQWFDDYGRALVLEDPKLGFLNELRLRHGVAELEGIAVGSEPLMVRPTESSEIIRENLNVKVSIFRFRPSSVSQVLTNIKVCLLDRLATCRVKISDLPDVQVAQEVEVLQLRPGFYGISIDLKALWRRISLKK